MTQSRLRWFGFAVLAGALAGCGDLPHPFQGNPGATARRLSAPPPARLAVPDPTSALLPQAASAILARDLSQSLLAQEVPAEAQPPKGGDWRLQTSAVLRAGQVVPQFAIYSPSGELRGNLEGAPVPPAEWSEAAPATLARTAEEAGPRLADLLTGIQASQMRADPHSLMNRPAKIYFMGVSGAPGDGDISLARQMTVSLPDGGNVVQNSASGADFTLRGQVRLTHLDAKTDHVEIVWTVTNLAGGANPPGGTEAGKVTQLNDIPAHTLDGYWGDVSAVVAQEAAAGVRQVITNNSGRAHTPVPPPPGAGAQTGHNSEKK